MKNSIAMDITSITSDELRKMNRSISKELEYRKKENKRMLEWLD